MRDETQCCTSKLISDGTRVPAELASQLDMPELILAHNISSQPRNQIDHKATQRPLSTLIGTADRSAEATGQFSCK